jgi:vacuolar-type H+-ATPase subunit H
MPESTRPSKADAAAAIDQVLAAETAAREAMEACRKEAEAILEAARDDARAIGRRANERISRLHARCDELVRSRVAELRAQASPEAVRTRLDAADRELLAQAVERLAARLTRPGNG